MDDNSFLEKFKQSLAQTSSNYASKGAAIPETEDTELVINPGLEALIMDSIDFGKKQAYEEAVKMANNRICFDYKTGNCDHGYCHAMHEIVIELEKKQNEHPTE